MKKAHLLVAVAIGLLSESAHSQTLLHYWNFNNSATQQSLLTPTSSAIAGASIAHEAGGISAIQITSNTAQGFDVTNPNARNGDAALTHLRFNDPIGGGLVFALPTTGFQDVVIKYATRRSTQGAGTQIIEYSTDGSTYTTFGTVNPVNGDPQLETLDFSAIPAADNNPDFKIRINFAQGPGGTGGNNRFDNFTAEGDAYVAPVPVLLHYWNFNNSATEQALLTPTESLVTGAGIVHVQGGTSEIQITSNTGQGFDVTNPNARNGDAALTHLRFNNPLGGALVFSLPTTGYRDIVVKYATRRSGQGAHIQQVEYSTDGTTYTTYGTVNPVDGNPTEQTFDFSAIPSVDNNADFKIRITFQQGGGGLQGNNRFDNFTADGISLTGIDTNPPTVVFAPLNNTQNVPVTVQPTITFNEPVRLISNSAIDNSNADALVELRVNDAAGAMVPFDATFDATTRTITLVPATTLANNQHYYVALKANVVEDHSNNAIASVSSAGFTTISLQTQFQPGDLVLVAYRMNATGAEDEIAFLSLVDILPGTQIHFTDAKYTTNAQPQCAGGFTWTAPGTGCVTAGTVVTIQNDAQLASIGTLSGAGFGLSSGGDQVIVYTGTPANPSYITALSSNEWLANNTVCNGSSSMRPAGLSDGTSSINLSTATGNAAGNTVNAYYNGTQTGTPAQLRAAILDPANWIGTGSGTATQTWPAWNFPGPPTVVSTAVVNQTTLQVVFSSDLSTTSATNLANFTGIAGLSSISQSNNGTVADTLLLTFSTPFTGGSSYTLTIDNVQNAAGVAMGCAYSYTFTYNTTIAFANAFVSVSEGAGTATIVLNLTNPLAATADLVLKPAPWSNATAADFTYTTQAISFTGTSSTHTISIPVIDDNVSEQDEYFVLSLENISGATLSGNSLLTVYIRDNDRQAPQPTQEITLSHIGSYDPVPGASTCEIVVHDPASQRIFTTSSVQNRLDISSFANPASMTHLVSIDMAPYGGITSVAVHNGILAVASPNADEQQNGSVVFFDTNGTFQKQVTVGALPDMITFSPDGNRVLTANEGQPNNAYTIDPEGSISVIDISGGIATLSQANVTTLGFTAFNSQEAALMAAGVRKLKSTSTLSQDLEPEYITVSSDSKKAWVTLQENNAIAEINLETNAVTDIWALGTKDYNVMGNGFDASDNSGTVHLSNWPVKAFFIPDAAAAYTVNGTTYLLTANEGDEKEYAGLNERTTVGAANLDATAFPHAAMLKANHNLGRLRMSNLSGDTDGDGDFDEIYVVGSRSFSIFNTSTRTLVSDSGDEFEHITSTHPAIAPLFNSDNEANGLKGRSRAKGPEPEGATVAKIGNEHFAFIALERVGGVMVYNVTDPQNPRFVDYKNSRNLLSYGGDNGPEGIIYISGANSPNGSHYILVANEISGTVAVFEVQGIISSSEEAVAAAARLSLYPNPANGSEVFFSREVSVQLYDAMGRVVKTARNTRTLGIAGLAKGMYLVRTEEGTSLPLVIE